LLLLNFVVQREDGGFDLGVEEDKNKCVSPPPAAVENPTAAKKPKTSGVFKGDVKKTIPRRTR
jgi:hypothetical protein